MTSWALSLTSIYFLIKYLTFHILQYYLSLQSCIGGKCHIVSKTMLFYHLKCNNVYINVNYMIEVTEKLKIQLNIIKCEVKRPLELCH